MPSGPETLWIGDLSVLGLADARARLDPAELYGGPAATPGDGPARGGAPADWAPHADLLDADGRLDMPVGSFLVRTADRVLVIDLGYGPQAPHGIDGGHLLDALAGTGPRPGAVTDVVFTHLHPDHVGWASVDGRPTFPGAAHHCHPADWALVVDGPGDADSARALGPVADLVAPFTGDATVAPGVDVRTVPGHTPGNAVVVLSGGTDRAVLLGDVVHCPVELRDDGWAALGDIDPVLARRTRAALLQELEGSGAHLSAPHFTGLRFGRLLPAQGRRRWVV